MSARFVFELQPVLDQRQRVEEEHQRRVAAIERQRLALEEQLRECQRSIAAAKAELRHELDAGSGGGTLALATVRLQVNASASLAVRAQRQAIELAGVHARLQAARHELLAATTARKAVELLRSRRYEQWKREQARREQAALDELMVMRAGTRRAPIAEHGLD